VKTFIDNKIAILENGTVSTPIGFRAGGLHCGIKRKRLDLGWILSDVPATAAGVYTRNAFQAAPILVTKESIAKEQKLQAVVVNSGNANACTGKQGLFDAYQMRNQFAKAHQLEEHFVAVSSTGIIGVPLPMEKLIDGIHQSTNIQHHTVENFEHAILTTDTCVKHVAVEIVIDGKPVKIGGAAKGSGMIHPNMATMLAFVTTDAKIDAKSLSTALKTVTDQTFNMITVDGDTSTNDMVLVLANGLANNDTLNEFHPEWEVFLEGFNIVCKKLAQMIARDGEGATKLIEVQVNGAPTEDAAKKISKAIISSNLVKTAMYGADPNWGRIVCAIGYSDEPINPNKVNIHLGPIQVVENGLPLPFDEEKAKQYLLNEFIHIIVDFHQGLGSATAWGCDLSYDYVKINASYRT